MATNDHHLVYFSELTILMGLRIIVTQFALILQYFQFMIYLLINREEEGMWARMYHTITKVLTNSASDPRIVLE